MIINCITSLAVHADVTSSTVTLVTRTCYATYMAERFMVVQNHHQHKTSFCSSKGSYLSFASLNYRKPRFIHIKQAINRKIKLFTKI